MPVVTIRGNLGSGAPEIGRLVADILHIDYVDREIIAGVAEVFNRGEQDVIVKEMPPGSFLGRVLEYLEKYFPSKPSDDLKYLGAYLTNRVIPIDDTRYVTGLEHVIKDLASNSSIVIRGRGSQFILKDHPNAIHVLILAPLEIRLARVMNDMGFSKEQAAKEIDSFDGSRREFARRYFDVNMEDTQHYDLVINTDKLTYEDAASIVVDAVAFSEASILRIQR